MNGGAKVLAALALLIAAPCAAQAHAMLDRANPPVGGTIAAAPKELVLWFTEKLEPAFSSAEVRNAQGVVQSGKAQVDRNDAAQLRVPLKALPGGTYQVIWRVLSVDTHRTQGSFSFRVGP
jgi:copper resistance protein C